MSIQYSRVAAGEEDDGLGGSGSGSMMMMSTQQLSSSLQENLVGPSPDQAIPIATSTPMMQVVAPATLPEGYEFEASIGGNRTIKVKVPPGGVEEGQKFEVPMPQQFETMMTGISIPVGHWRDSLWNLFGYGACHPSCWTACMCHLLAAGQVISRLKLTWRGREGTPGEAAVAFKIIFTAVVVYFAIYIGLLFVLISLDPNIGQPIDAPQIPPGADYIFVAFIRDIFHYVYWIITTIVLTNLRGHVRHKYAIPSTGEFEDCCCSCWCPCLVSAQMLRHTTDYDVYPSTCCTERGIPQHAPSIV